MKHLDGCPAINFEDSCTCEVNGVCARCVDCRKEFSAAEIKGANACPSCGSTGIPMSPLEDVQIKINWHELRILGMWAENWAATHKQTSSRMLDTISAITTALEEQFPSYTPLMLARELGQVAERYEIEVTGPIQPELPKRKLQ